MTTNFVPNGYVPVGFSGVQDDPEGWLYMVPVQALTELPPPVPPEPEPGAYLIAGVPCIRMARGADDPSGYASHGRKWILGTKVPRTGWFAWKEALEVLGAGPNVTITRLVPKSDPLPDVELPWHGEEYQGDGLRVERYDATSVSVAIMARATAWVTLDTALAMAAALITAARSTEDGSS